MIVPIYNSEVAPPEVRGALVSLQQLAICFGIMISFWIDYGTNFIGGTKLETQSDAAWLTPICLQIAPALVLFFGMLFMPFSPRWLVHHGREDEARRVLARLRALPADHELVELEFLEIKAQSMFEKRTVAEKFPHLREQTAWNTFKLQFVAIKSLFQTKAMFKRVIVACVTMAFQQWTGINVSCRPTSKQIISDFGHSIDWYVQAVLYCTYIPLRDARRSVPGWAKKGESFLTPGVYRRCPDDIQPAGPRLYRNILARHRGCRHCHVPGVSTSLLFSRSRVCHVLNCLGASL